MESSGSSFQYADLLRNDVGASGNLGGRVLLVNVLFDPI